MQFKLFIVPISNYLKTIDEMNIFLRSHKIITHTKELVNSGENSFYSILVEYLDSPISAADKGKSSVDYKDILKPEEFALFSYLRDERKKLAEQAGIPIYAVLNNAQLSQIAVEKPKSISELSKIEGIGQGKCEKFGEAFLRAIQDYEKKRQSISQDNRME